MVVVLTRPLLFLYGTYVLISDNMKSAILLYFIFFVTITGYKKFYWQFCCHRLPIRARVHAIRYDNRTAQHVIFHEIGSQMACLFLPPAGLTVASRGEGFLAHESLLARESRDQLLSS